jgi:uncharacterized protein (TIGR02147 family)
LKQTSIKPDIFKYDDDISFLRDQIEYLRERDKKFTLRQLARTAELAVGYLPMCLSKKRNLSLNALDKIIDLLKLAADEKKLLRLLRQIALTESADERVEHLHSMQRLKAYRDNNAPEVEVFKYLTSWLNVAILELARSPEFKPSAPWIQSRLSFPSTILDIEKAMEVLKSIRYVEETDNGSWLVKEKLLNCNEGIFKISLGEFHRQILHLVAQAIETQPRSERLILGHTMAVSEKGAELAREVLSQAQRKLEQIGIEQTKTDRVCHFELCGITVAKHMTGVDL